LNWNFKVLVFADGGKTKEPRENAHVALGLGLKSGRAGGR